MKKALFTILLFLGTANIAYAAPSYTFSRSILPEATNSYDLGSTTLSKVWNSIFVNNIIRPGITDGCATWSSSLLTTTGTPCGSGGGGGGGAGTFSTTTIASRILQYPYTSLITSLGGASTSTSPWYFDPVTLIQQLAGQLIANYVTATSTTQASTFPLANITRLSNLTSNGFVKTSGGNGTLSVDTNTYLTSAITALGPLNQTQTGATQTLATSTTGTDFTITASGNTQVFNLPVASAVNTGKLSSTDWSTFNNKAGFSYASNYALINAATTTPIWAQSGINASSTSHADYLNLNAATLNGSSSPAYQLGKLIFDTSNDSLTFLNSDNQVSLQIGQESWARVVNNTGSTIANGAAVYVNGSSGGMPTVALAQANSGATTVVLGLMTETCTTGSTCFVTQVGRVRNIDTSAFSIGNIYLSASTPGALTQTIPTAPNYRYRAGFVTNVNAVTGSIDVTPSTAFIGNGTGGQLLYTNFSGNLDWIATSSLGISGGGSGTVSAGLAGQLGYYNASGTTIQGTSTNPLYVGSLVSTSSTATSTIRGPVVIGSTQPTNGTTTSTFGSVTFGMRACINMVTFSGGVYSTSSIYMIGANIIGEANACR